MITGGDIVETTRGCLNTPFLHQGRIKGLGLDCAGLIVYPAHTLGLSDFDNTNYSRSPDGVSLERTLNQQMQRIPFTAVSPGDILLFAFLKNAQHLAIVTQLNPIYIIHSHEPNGRVIEHRLDSVWRGYIRGSYRYHGVSQ